MAPYKGLFQGNNRSSRYQVDRLLEKIIVSGSERKSLLDLWAPINQNFSISVTLRFIGEHPMVTRAPACQIPTVRTRLGFFPQWDDRRHAAVRKPIKHHEKLSKSIHRKVNRPPPRACAAALLGLGWRRRLPIPRLMCRRLQ